MLIGTRTKLKSVRCIHVEIVKMSQSSVASCQVNIITCAVHIPYTPRYTENIHGTYNQDLSIRCTSSLLGKIYCTVYVFIKLIASQKFMLRKHITLVMNTARSHFLIFIPPPQ
jgi:hypothetical protein